MDRLISIDESTFFKEHTKNARPSTKRKHERGKARSDKDEKRKEEREKNKKSFR